jgi:4'-phosphopantetheinyl transferase
MKIGANQVHLWALSFEELKQYQAELAACLVPNELTRSNQFKQHKDVSNYQLCRGMLRKILAHYLGGAPQSFSLQTTDFGKPYLAGNDLHFNVSHSGAHAIIALAAVELGVDIENAARHCDMLPIAKRFFTTEEVRAIESQPADVIQRYACQLWCCKEAFVKAIGRGLSFGLERFDVSIDEHSGASLTRVADEAYMPSEWSMALLPAPVNYLAALAIPLTSVELTHFDAINHLK